ncbi:hypothetical protein B4918_04485 [Bacillus thuringiensis]|uniref:Uncharacterized protein n=1 Tax=Bacillus thuringiensis TaxID=1428 RepID=A0A9W3TIV6_BACTU|nr:hypothetical protein B4918_04485 [Bacillus thuringiensis]MDR4148321.1 hypothetical protein [Bacillus thuringiensis]
MTSTIFTIKRAPIAILYLFQCSLKNHFSFSNTDNNVTSPFSFSFNSHFFIHYPDPSHLHFVTHTISSHFSTFQNFHCNHKRKNKQKKAYRRLTICTKMHKKRTLRYTQRTLLIRQRMPYISARVA